MDASSSNPARSGFARAAPGQMRMSAPAAPRPVILVRALRRGQFVEFEYSLDEGELAVELILPLEAFHEFCATTASSVTSDDPKILANLFTLTHEQRLNANG